MTIALVIIKFIYIIKNKFIFFKYLLKYKFMINIYAQKKNI